MPNIQAPKQSGDLPATARLVLTGLRERPRRDTVQAIVAGPLGRVLEPDAVRSALVELRGRKLAREAKGRWHLTREGRAARVVLRGARPTGSSAACEVSAMRRGTVATISLSGRIDGSGADQLDDEVTAIIDRDDPPEIVVIDLAHVTALTDAGVAAVADADTRGRRTGARVVVTGTPPEVRRALSVTSVGDRLTYVGRLEWS